MHIENFSSTQDYAKIKQRFSNTNRFTDNEFKATDSSVYHTSQFKNQLLNRNRYGYGRSDRIIWKRAKVSFFLSLSQDFLISSE